MIDSDSPGKNLLNGDDDMAQCRSFIELALI